MKKFSAVVPSFLLLCLAIISVSCHQKAPENKKLVFSPITNKICDADTSQSYEVYIPNNKGQQKTFPVIYAFDPHGDGKLAASHLRQAAEKFGFIIAASSNSKNGLQTLDYTLDILVKDVQKNLPVNPERQYAAGFSGGGRVAGYLASKTGNLKGIITCGAGFDPQNATAAFDVYAIAGKEDFNYDEVMALNQQLANTTWRFVATSFDGGHNWPPDSELTRAVLWFQLNAMRDGTIPKNTGLCDQERDSFFSKADRYVAGNQFINAAAQCRTGISFLKDLVSTKKLQKKLEEIESKPEYAAEVKKSEQLGYMEQQLRQAYLQAFSNQKPDWWKKELQALDQKIATDKNKAETQMLKRMKAFLGIVCYSYTSRAIAANDLQQAQQIIAIYELVDPKNPDCFFYKAVLMDRQHQYPHAAASYREALQNGFAEISKARELLSPKTLQTATVK